MGKNKKLKKQRRDQRVKQTRDLQRKQMQTTKRSKFIPLYLAEPIVFVRGEDYVPVKYSMAESRNMHPNQDTFEPLDEPLDAPEPLDDPSSGSIPDQSPAPDLEPELETLLSDSPGESQGDSPTPMSTRSPTQSPVASPSPSPAPSPASAAPQGSHASPESLFDSVDSDAQEIDSEEIPDFHQDPEDYIDLDGAVYPSGPSGSSDSESELEMDMDADIDFNDMELEELLDFEGHVGDDYDYYDYDEDIDSDADDIISGLISGASLDQFAKPTKKQRSKPEKELSKRRKARLEARESARATNFGKDPPLWQKYPEKMTVHEVLQELQILVATPNLQEIMFPPLDHNANFYVSELAKLHCIKVKSYTKSKANCVRAIKTSRSCPPDHNTLRKLISRRQTFPRIDKRPPAGPKEPKVKTSRPKEGDIVGHNAQAVSDGFGHRLLLQMGWSDGSGLGAERDGIQAPLLARVKLTKRGL